MSAGLLVIYMLFSSLHLVRPLLKVNSIFSKMVSCALDFHCWVGKGRCLFPLRILAFIQLGRLKIRVQAKQGSRSWS